MKSKEIIVDASETALGRVASFAAKQALLGKEVIIVNCNNVLITGRKRTTINSYQIKRKRGGASLKGPNFPKSPERLMKRTIRGMLNYKQQRALSAFKRIKCYNDVPENYANSKKFSIARDLRTKSISLLELNKEI